MTRVSSEKVIRRARPDPRPVDSVCTPSKRSEAAWRVIVSLSRPAPTGSGCDRIEGKHVKDLYLGLNASLGACRPDIRRRVNRGDQIFVVSGKVRNTAQVISGGYGVAEKISAIEAYERLPIQRPRHLPDRQVTENVIVNAHQTTSRRSYCSCPARWG